jgi:hypothetical protein
MFILQLMRLRRFESSGYGGGSNLATDIALER